MIDAAPRCTACGIELAPGLHACPGCRKLVHSERLVALAAEAAVAEREGRLTEAMASWREALDLLPAKSNQRRVVSATVQRLSQSVDRGESAAPAKSGKGAGKGAVGATGVALVLWKLKLVFLSLLGKGKLVLSGLASLPTLLSMFAYLALDRSRGATFALGLVLSIYVHEMGHVSALRRFGIQATAPMFVPGLGALVRLKQYPIDAREDARVGLAGPVWGCFAAAIALALGLALHQRTLLGVASIGAMINVLNLVPVWQLDGARGFRALDPRQRTILVVLAAGVALALQQPMGWAVCAVGGARLKSDLPEQGDRRAFFTFAALLILLSVIPMLCKLGSEGP
ncbi:MAG: site-2 protease family protein [Byssovorax sp.]